MCIASMDIYALLVAMDCPYLCITENLQNIPSSTVLRTGIEVMVIFQKAVFVIKRTLQCMCVTVDER